MTPQNLALILLLLLIPAAIGNWACVIILHRASRFDGAVLRERRNVALILAHAMTLYFIVGLNTTLGYPWFDPLWAPVVNRLILILIGLIPLLFLYLFWRRKI